MKIAGLRRVVDRLLVHVERVHGPELRLDEDYYWERGEGIYDLTKDISALNEIQPAVSQIEVHPFGQIVLCWVVQLGVVAPAKTVRKERMVENLAIFDFELDEDEMVKIATLDTGTSSFFSHPDPGIVKWMSERKLDV